MELDSDGLISNGRTDPHSADCLVQSIFYSVVLMHCFDRETRWLKYGKPPR